MLRACSRYFASIPPVFIDGLIWIFIAWFAFCQQYLGGDEAAKFITPAIKFWLLFSVGSGAVICGALKMFRNTSYAEHQKTKQVEAAKQSETAFFAAKQTPAP